MIVLVTGASGFVGSHLVPVLLGDGHRIAALARSDQADDRIMGRVQPADRSRIEVRRGDVTDLGSLADAMAGIDAVVHLAAIPRDRDGGASLRLVNTEGTRNVVVAMGRSGVRRLVHMSAMGVVDDPRLHYASSKAKGEAIVRASDLDWTALKPSLQWGERDGFFNILAGLIRISPGLLPVPGRGRSRFQPIASDDVARVVTLALARPDTTRRTYEIGGPRAWTYREMAREVVDALGAHRVIVPMPVPLISLVARTSEMLGLPFPVASDQLRQLRLDNVGPLDEVERSFGFRPADMAGGLGYLRRRLADQEPTVD
jgi:NADH dehydrogenase